MKTKLVASLLMGTMAVGTVALTFNGETTLSDTMNYLKQSTAKLELFKSNETKLVGKIGELKTSKKALLDQISTLEKSNSDKATEITNLKAQVEQLNARIVELEELLANGGSNNEELQAENTRLKAELDKANSEITKANNLVANLQSELNAQKAVTNNIQPITGAELDKVLNDATEPTTPPTTPTEPTNPPTNPPTTNFDYTIDASSNSYYFEDLTISIMSSKWIFEGTAQYPVVIYFADGTTQNADPNGIVTISKKIVKIEYKTSAGTTKTVQVNR